MSSVQLGDLCRILYQKNVPSIIIYITYKMLRKWLNFKSKKNDLTEAVIDKWPETEKL